MKVIKNLNPKRQDRYSKGLNNETEFCSFTKHEDVLIFGCGGYNDDYSHGIAVYDKDLNMIKAFETKNSVFNIISLDKHHVLLG
jgi:hypothetical protein